ncbi:hypothetical protein B0H13DRAFT_1854693 [Mycena leptocephala]|nr:hypothetical protein B0H13DRAFT_1854693 [Mycena leptocephala]
MSDTFIDNTWGRILNLPDAPVADFNRELAGYTFDTHGTGDDYEVEMFPPADRLLDTLPAFSGHSRPSFPFIDLLTMPDKTPKPRAALTYMGPPPTPTPTSHFVLKDLNAFPPVHMDFSMMEGTPLRPDDFSIAADRKRGLYNDETRTLIGNSGTEKMKRPVGRPKKVKENASPTDDASTTSKAHYNGDDLISIARAVVDVNPFIAPYGKNGIAWQEVVDKLVDQNFRHKAVNAVTVQHKAEALTSYEKDPLGKHKNLANVIGDGKSASITIGALLERLETQYDESKDKSDDAKAKLKSKQDADREGGEAIRRASMQTLRHKRARSPSTSDDEDKHPDTEQTTVTATASPSPSTADADDATAPSEPAAGPSESATEPANTSVSASSSLETLDSDAEDNKKSDQKKSKRRRTMDRRTSTAGTDTLVQLLKAENARRAAHDAEVAASFNMFVKDAREQKNEVTSLLKDLVNLAEREL